MWAGERPRTTGSEGMLRVGERVFLKEEHTTSYLVPNVGLKNLYTSNFTQTNQVAVRNVNIYTYIYACYNNEKRCHEFERRQEKYIGMFGGREEKGEG